jgi:peptidoglycan/xylan/chitin deacetylase (PgdA/CDA1 family)
MASELEQKIKNNESDKKIAYLTFDDGPYYATHDFLKVLKQYRVKATFFTIRLDKEKCYDNRSKKCHELYNKVVTGGHTTANHTYSHLIFNGLYSSTSSLINQIKKHENFIKEKTGVTTNIFRFPGGSGSAKAYGVFNGAVKELRKMNYGWVDWTAQDGDGGNLASKEQALTTFKNSINQDIEVVLFHDYNRITLEMLPEFIEYLQEKGYILLPLFYESNMINK